MNRVAGSREKLRWVTRSARAERVRAATPRLAFLGCVAITSILGVKAIVMPPRLSQPGSADPSSVDLASESYALDFARAYLGTGGAPGRGLRGFLPPALERDVPPRRGQPHEMVTWTQVASDHPDPSGGRLIVVAAGLGPRSSSVFLAVSVSRRASGALQIDRLPAFVGAPKAVVATTSTGPRVANPAVLAVVKRVLANYLSDRGSKLATDLVKGSVPTTPGLGLRIASYSDLRWDPRPASDFVLATVRARSGLGVQWTLTYAVGVRHRSSRPLCTYIEIAPTSQPAEPSPQGG